MEWTFLSNHGRALLCIAHDPGVRLRDVASDLDITERRAYGIVADLAAAGYVMKKRDGRRNRYEIRAHLPLPERVESPPSIGDVLDLLVGTDRQQRREPDAVGPLAVSPRQDTA